MSRDQILPDGFDDVITTGEQLDERYRAPSRGALDKETDVLDEGCCDFLARSTFVLIGTSNADGDLDVSPRGGPAGFVKALDERRLAIPDLNGNNRLDSLRNIVEHPRIGLLFVIPGLGETLRVNGRACITVADDVLDLFTAELRRPRSAIGVEVEHAFIHCAKSLRRGGLWEPDSWPDAECRPSPAQMLVDHIGIGDKVTGAQLESALEEGYASDLAADLPEPAEPH